MRERATARLNDLVGSSDTVGDEPLHLLLPHKFRKNRAWTELNKIWRNHTPVKGFYLEKVRGGYAVAIGGFITFLPFRYPIGPRIASDRFTVVSINPKKSNIVVY
ncbi:Ribosomal protein S1 [Quillaja saponaria]|uniref:Ribosomal protein S1 n=1 Tax=Quillaja saponaria TaxID=32244 RepID=A0AAD7LL85_QUISA|nr:Ribosomal protein S1 [Quillaja saponaria]